MDIMLAEEKFFLKRQDLLHWNQIHKAQIGEFSMMNQFKNHKDIILIQNALFINSSKTKRQIKCKFKKLNNINLNKQMMKSNKNKWIKKIIQI